MMLPRGILGLKKNTRRRCLSCRQLFRCHPRTRLQQKFCSEPTCRAASKKASQARWLGKVENQGYFSGPQHVSRVQAWRQMNPEYAQKSRRKRPALQETIKTQPLEPSRENSDLPLQDPMRLQVAVTVGPNGLYADGALQDPM